MPLQHLRSSTAHKRPIPTVMSAGQIAINTNEASPGLFFKDSNGDLVKVGPVHIGPTAPNSSPASVAATALVTGTVYQILTVGTSDFTLVGASANTVGTIFTATGTTTGTGTVSGQQGVEKGEQWLDTTGGTYVLKIYDGTDWRSESGTFVDVSGDTMTGDLVMNNANIVFEGATADDFETTLTVTDPTADRTITLPNVTGTVVTTGDTGTVTSTMIADGTIVNADVNASAAIAHNKLANITAGQVLLGNASNVPTATALSGDITVNSSGVTAIGSGVIVDADVSASAEIAVSKLANGTARQLLQTDAAGTGVEFTSNVDVPGTLDVTGAATFDSSATIVGDLTVDTNTLYVDSSNNRVGVGTTSPSVTLHLGNDSTFRINNPDGTRVLDLFNDANNAEIKSSVDPIRINAVHSNGYVRFDTNNTERARIDSSGRLLVGTSSGSYQLQLSTDSAGKPSTNTWTIVSDERIKEEIELADLDLCYEAVKNIPLKRFKWKDEVYTEEQAYDRRKLGWIAQDVEAVFPKAVRQHEFKYNQVFEEIVVPAVPEELDDDGKVITEAQPERIEKGELISEEVIEDCRDLNSDQLYAAMYGAIQKLISKVETLEAEIAALKA